MQNSDQFNESKPVDLPRPGHRTQDYEYTALMSSMHVSVSKHLLDEHFTVVWANDFYYEIIGYSKEEYESVFHNCCDLFYVNDMEEYEKIKEAVTSAIVNKQPSYSLVTHMPHKGGTHTWVRMVGTFTDETQDGIPVVYTVFTDITDLVQTQKEQSITFDSIPGFIAKFAISKDLELELLEASESFIRFFGAKSLTGKNDPLFRRNLEQNFEVIRHHKDEILAGKKVRFVVQMCDCKGNDAWLQVNASCVDWQGDKPVYLVIYLDVTDITELREMKQQLEEQKTQLQRALEAAEHANQAKSEFLSRMSHDIRTPMNAIMGMTEIAKDHISDPQRVTDCLKKISISSKHLLGLINDVLDMSKIESGKMTPNNNSMSLAELLENVVSINQPAVQAKNQQFSIRLKNVKHEQLYCDALRLRQIFINILSNAIKFTPENGMISLDVEEYPSERPDYTNFEFTFKDTGIGMKPEFIEHIFDSFTREHDSRVDKAEGSGLGMAITKKIVDMLDGTISVSSVPNEGSTFVVDLPLKVEQEQTDKYSFESVRALVVDDDKMLCKGAAQTLGDLGVEADWVTSGAKAVERVVERHRGNSDYDVVILDWKMPGMDGVDTVRAIREQVGSSLPILIASSYDWTEIEEDAIAVGVNGFISKPLFRTTLCHALQKYLGGPNGNLAGNDRDTVDFTGKKFLLVEDNELNREIAVELLSATGAVVECACDGKLGVEKFGQSQEGYYSLILMDIQMPVMNGYRATETIRKMDREDAKNIPILAMTADAFAEDIIFAKSAGMDGHLAKPLEFANLAREIGRYLNQSV